MQVSRAMSRDRDVIGRCAAADSPTKRFYFMTSPVDDEFETRYYDTEHSSKQTDRQRDEHGEKDEQGNGERETSREMEYEQEIQQADDNRRQDDDDKTLLRIDAKDENFRHTDTVDKSLKKISQQHPEAIIRQSEPCLNLDPYLDLDLDLDLTLIDVDTFCHGPTTNDFQKDDTISTISVLPCDVSATQTKYGRSTKNADDIQFQRQSHSLPMTKNSQPIGHETETTGNRISFDRKLIDEIDAVMARNGCKPLHRGATGTAHSSAYSQIYEHTHADQTVNRSGESHQSCDVEDCGGKSGHGRTGSSIGRRRRRRRMRVKHEMAPAVATLKGLSR